MGSYPVYESQIFLFLIVFSPARNLFMMTLLLGLTIAVCSSSWFGVWIGLELNLLSFIPLISIKDNQYSSEAALKYFLIQALGSIVLLISAVIVILKIQIFSISLSAALLLKIGAAPFHFWFPPTLEGIIWPQALILITIQKIAPISLLSYYILDQTRLIFISILLSAIVGALGGLNQTLLRKLLAYSSINHISWIIASLMTRENTWLIYFLVYSLISSSVVLIFYSTQVYHFNHLIRQVNHKPVLKMRLLTRLLSLGGLPPFTGFVPKWIVIQQLALSDNFFTLLILLGSSLFTLFYYLRITLSSLMFNSDKIKTSSKSNIEMKLIIVVLVINFLGLLTPSMIFAYLS